MHINLAQKHALLKFSINDIRKNFEFFVRVGAEPSSGLDPVLIENAQMSKAHMIIVSIPKNKGSLSIPARLYHTGEKKHAMRNSRGK